MNALSPQQKKEIQELAASFAQRIAELRAIQQEIIKRYQSKKAHR